MELRGLRLLFVFLSLVFLVANVVAQPYYKVDLFYEDGEMSIKSVEYVFVRGGIENPTSEEFEQFNFELYDSSGNVIHSENVSIMNFDFVENLSVSGGFTDYVYFDEFNYTVYLPYFEDSSEIVVKKTLGKDWGKSNYVIYEEGATLEMFEEESGSLFFRGKSGLIFYFVIFILILVVVSLALYFYFSRGKRLNSKGHVKGKGLNGNYKK